MLIGIAGRNDQIAGTEYPFIGLIRGIKALGHDICISLPSKDSTFDDCDAVFTWNLASIPAWREMMAVIDRPVFIMERGWFDRDEYTQIDPSGFNHSASWAHEVTGPAPVGGAERYRMLAERLSPRKRVESRPDGYALILGQTGIDEQLKQSEIHHADALCDAVKASLPAGLDCAFRGHPLSKWRPKDMQTIDGTLDDALKYSRFVITINSNAGNDALWAGVPVLCLGPALYEIAGAARRTTIATLLHDMEFMCRGWEPDEKRVMSYFHWLSSRQWNREELQKGDCLKQLLGDADG